MIRSLSIIENWAYTFPQKISLRYIQIIPLTAGKGIRSSECIGYFRINVL